MRCYHPLQLGEGNSSFLWGVATSTFQDSGTIHCPSSQWAHWERRLLAPAQWSKRGVDLFSMYGGQSEELLSRLEQLQVNSYRFSVDWSQIEPEQGEWKEAKLEVYCRWCEALVDRAIEPVVTLHHFSEPRWFHDLGSFEKEGNSDHFVRFCQRVVERLAAPYGNRNLVRYFLTFNEPTVEASCRYLLGLFSPGLYGRVARGERFLLQMIAAHAKVYALLKEGGLCDRSTQIGFSHQYLHFLPNCRFARPLTSLLNRYQEQLFSLFAPHQPGRLSAVPPTDFVGVQFYGRVHVGWRGVQSCGRLPTTMMGIYEDPEGLFEAVTRVYDVFRVPLFISENGISTSCDEQRSRYLIKALSHAEAARRAIGEENLKGYFLWSFCDNFEWCLGWQAHFGAYGLTSDRKLQPHYKVGVRPFVDAISGWKRTTISPRGAQS